jgi:hypothetical protein
LPALRTAGGNGGKFARACRQANLLGRDRLGAKKPLVSEEKKSPAGNEGKFGVRYSHAGI